MESRGAAIARHRGAPLTLFEHPALVSLADLGAAVAAGILCLARAALRPAQVCEVQNLRFMAVRTRHKVPALVARTPADVALIEQEAARDPEGQRGARRRCRAGSGSSCRWRVVAGMFSLIETWV
jgi:hypothetical protein